MTRQQAPEEKVRTVGRAVRETVRSLCAELRALDEPGWNAPSACTGWTVRDVTSHMAESNDRFFQVVRAALADEPPPAISAEERTARREAVKARPTAEIVDQLEQRMLAIFDLLERAPATSLARTVTVPAGQLSLDQVAETRLSESTLHNWDIRSPRDPAATLPSAAAALMFPGVLAMAARLARREKLQGLTATYHLQTTGPGGGPVTIEVHDGVAQVSRGAPTKPDATVRLPVEACIRLIWGRLDLEHALATGLAQADGDRPAVQTLGEMFRPT
jgi:uncharacterized protein (TIGR03083 family)